jgi:2-polyprenyl-6-hydroxyphenyl methylase/3-demethylubiquinone-9 3-methyltransferase
MKIHMSMAHDDYVRRRFDILESRFKDEIAEDDFRVAALLRTLETVADKRILDLGCGKGRIARRLAERGANVIGLDPSTGMLNRAGGIPRVQGASSRLPFGDGQFDAVIAVEVFEHLANPDAAVAECARVCRRDGRLLIIDKNRYALNDKRPWLPAAWVKRIDERRGRWMYPNDAPARERWFGIESMHRRLACRFFRVDHESLLQPSESGRPIFRTVSKARLFVLWAGQSPRRLT